MAGRYTADGRQHHCAKYSDSVLVAIGKLLDLGQLDRPIVDPFAGTGEKLSQLLGNSPGAWWGIELEPEFAAITAAVRQGDALDPWSYPPNRIGSVVTSVAYGNRMADPYLGPACKPCSGSGREGHRFPDGTVGSVECGRCHGVGHDPTGRQSYAVSLGRRLSKGSSASMRWGPKYWAFHVAWLGLIAVLLEPGPNRLVLNASDFNADKSRVFAVDWWVRSAGDAGFRLDYAERVRTPRLKHNHLRGHLASPVGHEVVMVFHLPASAVRWTRPSDGLTVTRRADGSVWCQLPKQEETQLWTS